jgi:glycosyltransferase involved in cell wall biosynthesis
MKVCIDTTPLQSGHAIRGIGMYTKQLLTALRENTQVEVLTDESGPAIADLIHYPYFDLFFDTLPLTFSKRAVVTIHDVIPLEFKEYYKPGIKGALRFEKQKLASRFAQAILTDSLYSKQKIHELLGTPLNKITVIYLAANPQLQPQPQANIAAVRQKYKLPETYCLYVGDINYNKNIPQLIKALKYLPEEITLVCVGKNFIEQPIPEWQWIASQLEMSQVHDRVQFITDIPTDAVDEIASLYSGAVCYVQPSLSEGFGLPVLEALQCNCPVVSSNRGSLPEVGGDVARYVEPVAEDLAKGILQIFNLKSAERATLQQRGRDWAQHFSWRKTAEETVAVYKKILSKK